MSFSKRISKRNISLFTVALLLAGGGYFWFSSGFGQNQVAQSLPQTSRVHVESAKATRPRIERTLATVSPDFDLAEDQSAAEVQSMPYDPLDEMILTRDGKVFEDGLSSEEEIRLAQQEPSVKTHKQDSTDPRFEDQASLRDEYVTFEVSLESFALSVAEQQVELPIVLDYELFDGVRIGFQVQKHVPNGDGSGVFLGSIEGYEGSFAVMAYQDDSEAGTFSIPNLGEYRITYAGNGVHRISELNVAAIPGCGNEEIL